MIVLVIVDVPAKVIDHPFSYMVPKQFEEKIQIGMRVFVPFGSRNITGYVIGVEDGENQELKYIHDLIDQFPILDDMRMQLANFLHEKTSAPYASCYSVMIPSVLGINVKPYTEISNSKIYLSELKKSEIDRLNPSDIEYELNQKVKPKTKTIYTLVDQNYNAKNDAQKEVIDVLKDGPLELKKTSSVATLLKHRVILGEEVLINRLEIPKHAQKQIELTKEQLKVVNDIDTGVHLLHGVTGSGKTEVYIECIKQLNQDEQAIVLVPEISVSVQLMMRFAASFPNQVAILHSGLSDGEYYDEYRRIKSGEAKVVIGPRSAIFAPIQKLGIIIIDEEHASSYRQEDAPRYHAREVAKWMQQYYQIPLLLGSATPSIESFARAKKGLYKLHELTARIYNELPDIHVVDMKDEVELISNAMDRAVRNALNQNEQIILLLNRRGYANFVQCSSCGEVLMCDDCDVSYTLHKSSNHLRCHYCGDKKPVPHTCPSCGSSDLTDQGIGTEQLEEQLKVKYPNAIVRRMDHDSMRRKGAKEELIQSIEAGEVDIVLGTQMITKGFDFPNVTVVGVLNCDQMLFHPDFRASEETYQMLTQVAGRAGRHHKKGHVYLQTYNPEHYAIQSVDKTFQSFYDEEMKMRKLGNYVPYYFVETITVLAKDFNVVFTEANKIKQYLTKKLSSNAIILGPVMPYISRIKNEFRVQITIKYRNEPSLDYVLQELYEYISDQTRVIIDRM